MDNKYIDDEFNLLGQYMDIYIQLILECKNERKLWKVQFPTFQYFKETINSPSYSLIIPHFKESKELFNNKITPVFAHGVGYSSGIAFRHYNYWMGLRYFTGGNILGDYAIDTKKLNIILKQHE